MPTTSCETNAKVYDQLNLLSPFRRTTNGSPESSSELMSMGLLFASSFLVTSAMPLVSSCCYSTQTSCCCQDWLPGRHILKASFPDLNLCNDSAVSQLSLSTSSMVFRASLKALTPSASSLLPHIKYLCFNPARWHGSSLCPSFFFSSRPVPLTGSLKPFLNLYGVG